jgi:hypothetical protein
MAAATDTLLLLQQRCHVADITTTLLPSHQRLLQLLTSANAI